MHDMTGADFMPHGFCFLWRPDLVGLHVISDALIAVSYFCIPFALLYFVRRRKDLPFQKVFLLFGAFILLCGTTHLLSIWVLWQANYYTEGVVKAATAVVSVGTAYMLVRLMPQALQLPSPSQLREANAQLKEANEKLEIANRKLEEMYRDAEVRNRVTLSAVVDNVIDGIITIDEQGNIESFNRACVSLFGYEASEVMGQNIKMLMPSPYHDEHDDYLKRYIATGDAKIIGTAGREVAARRKDGSDFPIALSVSAFMIDGDRHFSGIVRDISRQKSQDENRQRLFNRLTESNTELERFAYVASHDMQEPLRMVLNFSQIIATDYADRMDDEGREYLKIVSESALRMRDMITDLLDYARLGNETPRRGVVDLSVEMVHVETNLAALIADSAAVVSAKGLPVVTGNAVQLMRLLQNLVANAIKYHRPDVPPRIHVTAHDEGDQWHISVADNGIGIDAAFVKEIFDPFRRLHNWDAIKGTGLGLAVCRKIVDNHAGRIWAVSELGRGSTFHVTLPKTPHEA